ncbi:hypothetical protein RIF29_04310 [Crotalaria pallida]|uniref:ATPase family AAA domain-containing protein n=1 Tax=Crotalaria pallida TaxID=3830 RepID=A0AAN9J1M4_CROPI
MIRCGGGAGKGERGNEKCFPSLIKDRGSDPAPLKLWRELYPVVAFNWAVRNYHPITISAGFDPKPLERGVNVLKEISQSPNIKKAFELMKKREETKQTELATKGQEERPAASDGGSRWCEKYRSPECQNLGRWIDSTAQLKATTGTVPATTSEESDPRGSVVWVGHRKACGRCRCIKSSKSLLLRHMAPSSTVHLE